ncbi:hypothetical protein F2Q70_00026207 [Brassica cretica]|uniref:Uncharacterized protein n=1 Tax=Brassica cretica TaxID=69181 RepID=A0A8S9L485_BRACR|nr:hypothetical protein F2Q70_00026207 [Brassica cretica]
MSKRLVLGVTWLEHCNTPWSRPNEMVSSILCFSSMVVMQHQLPPLELLLVHFPLLGFHHLE